MTYCLAIALDEGLVFCSDSRTNAGPDRVSTYSKMHRFCVPHDRSLVILTAGNLATSQAVIAQLQRDIEEDREFNIFKARYVSDIADYLGELSLAEQAKLRQKRWTRGRLLTQRELYPGGPDQGSATRTLHGLSRGQSYHRLRPVSLSADR